MVDTNSTIDLSDLLSRLRRQGHNTEHLDHLDGSADECYLCTMGHAAVAIESIARANAALQGAAQQATSLYRRTLGIGPDTKCPLCGRPVEEGHYDHCVGDPIGRIVYEDGSPVSKPETDNSRRDVSFTWSHGITVALGGDPFNAVDIGAIVEKHAQRYQWGDDTLHGAIRSAVDEALAARK